MNPWSCKSGSLLVNSKLCIFQLSWQSVDRCFHLHVNEGRGEQSALNSSLQLGFPRDSLPSISFPHALCLPRTLTSLFLSLSHTLILSPSFCVPLTPTALALSWHCAPSAPTHISTLKHLFSAKAQWGQWATVSLAVFRRGRCLKQGSRNVMIVVNEVKWRWIYDPQCCRRLPVLVYYFQMLTLALIK